MHFLVNAWNKNASWLMLLKPLAWLFALVSGLRRLWYRNNARRYTSRYPVIVVGNITAGGTGKTPLVIYLAQQLQARGFSPGIVSRGYGSKAPSYPLVVSARSGYLEAGEEPLMIARQVQCPVIIDPDRVAAIRLLEQRFDCNVIISDDGLQHYAMDRTLEIAVVDGTRGLGNGNLLPAGPLREKAARLQTVDLVVCNGEDTTGLPVESMIMHLQPTHLVHLLDGKSLPVNDESLQSMTDKKVHAVAGIGNPVRFFNSLCGCGFDIITHIYRDHHLYRQGDIDFADELDVVMTEKDAVKCKAIANDRHWFLKVIAVLPDEFMQRVMDKLSAKTH